MSTNGTLTITVDTEQAIRLRRAVRARIVDLRSRGAGSAVKDLQPILDVLDEAVPAGEFPYALA